MKPLKIKHARRPLLAARDRHGVPHAVTDGFRGALYALGYLHALDRPTQMLFARAVASGHAAERIADKPELLETDRFFRRVGLHLHLQREVEQLDDETFAHIGAYCEGVNDGLKQVGRSLPMLATGFQKEPWDHQAVLLIGNLLSYGGLVVTQQQNERLLLELIHAGVAREKLQELFRPTLDDADFEMLAKIKIASRLSDEALELLTDLPRLAGSNAWAVRPERSATGHALLAADPHLEVNRLPAIWYEAVLRWGDHYVLGATLPGCPLFAIARTPRLAWGVTYWKADTSDYYIEDCRLGPEGWQYRRGSEWRNFRFREEVLLRKGGGSQSVRVYQNSLGTLESDPEVAGPGLHLLEAWTGHSEGTGRSMSSWIHVIGCNTTLEAMDVARECPQPTLAWVFADRDGHIGKQANGWTPKRGNGYSGLLPIPAWDEENHWQGWVEPERLPREYDPACGFVAAANESLDVAGGPLFSSHPLPNYRFRRIRERLLEMPQATLKDMQALQYDVISLQARELLKVFLPHVPEGELKDRLAAWDFNYAPESVEPTLFAHLYRNVLLEVFGQDPGKGGIGWRRMLYLCSRAGFSMMVVTCLDRLLKEEHSLWWQGRDKGELIRQAAERLIAAREEDEELDEPWEVTNAFRFTNRFFEGNFAGHALGFHTSELPMPGCHATPFQGHLLRSATRETTFAPSYHLVTDLGTDDAWTNLPGGPSESRFSAWYKNDIPLWCEGRYKRLSAFQEE